MKQLLIGTLICVFVFAACDIAVLGTVPVDDISGSNNDDPNINPTIDPPTIDPQTIALWAFPVVTELWEPVEYTNDEDITVTDAYLIDNWRQLQYIGENFTTNADLLEHTYYLTADITFPSRVDTDVPDTHKSDSYTKDGFVPIGFDSLPFTGNFDGQGFAITNISIIQNINNKDDYYSNRYVGLFGSISGTTPVIQNLTLRNAQVTGGNNVGILVGFASHAIVKRIIIEGGSVQGEEAVGGLIGKSSDSTVSHSSASASISGMNNVGGLIGGAENTTIELNYATGDVTGANNTGGLIGSAYRAKVENNYSLGTVNSPGTRTGGLIAIAQITEITTNYSRSEVLGAIDVGGLIGYTNNAPLVNNFWDISANSGTPPSNSYPTSGVGSPLSNMSNPGAAPLTSPTAASFTGFTFGSTTEGWNTPADGEWPTLYWQEEN